MTPLLTQVRDILQETNTTWAICGGFALDLFLGKQTRTHGDIDICVFEQNRTELIKYMLLHDWQVFQFMGQGKVLPLSFTTPSTPGRNIMCIKEGCRLIKFYPCEDKDMLLHQFFHTGIEQLDYLEFLFNRCEDGHFIISPDLNITYPLAKAVLFRDGLPYLAPELALLYKAASADNPVYQQDFRAVFPCLNAEQKSWFCSTLQQLYPQGHPWWPAP